MNFLRKLIRPQYRIIERGNDLFYVQRLEFYLWYTDMDAVGSCRNHHQAIREVEDMLAEDQRIKNYKTIKKVIHV